MKNIVIAVLGVISLCSISAAYQQEKDKAMLKNDVYHLLQDMESDGTLERYDGSDHVCRLIDYTYPRRDEK